MQQLYQLVGNTQLVRGQLARRPFQMVTNLAEEFYLVFSGILSPCIVNRETGIFTFRFNLTQGETNKFLAIFRGYSD